MSYWNNFWKDKKPPDIEPDGLLSTDLDFRPPSELRLFKITETGKSTKNDLIYLGLAPEAGHERSAFWLKISLIHFAAVWPGVKLLKLQSGVEQSCLQRQPSMPKLSLLSISKNHHPWGCGEDVPLSPPQHWRLSSRRQDFRAYVYRATTLTSLQWPPFPTALTHLQELP